MILIAAWGKRQGSSEQGARGKCIFNDDKRQGSRAQACPERSRLRSIPKGRGAGSKGEGFLIPLPTGIQAPAFMYAKHQNIYYAYGTLRERDAQVRKIMRPFPKPLYLCMGFSSLHPAPCPLSSCLTNIYSEPKG